MDSTLIKSKNEYDEWWWVKVDGWEREEHMDSSFEFKTRPCYWHLYILSEVCNSQTDRHGSKWYHFASNRGWSGNRSNKYISLLCILLTVLFGELSQYHGCWWPGSMGRRDTCSHDVVYVGHMDPYLREVFNNVCILNCDKWQKMKIYRIDGFVQDCSNSIANALELLQPCTKPTWWCPINIQHIKCKLNVLIPRCPFLAGLSAADRKRNCRAVRKSARV